MQLLIPLVQQRVADRNDHSVFLYVFFDLTIQLPDYLMHCIVAFPLQQDNKLVTADPEYRPMREILADQGAGVLDQLVTGSMSLRNKECEIRGFSLITAKQKPIVKLTSPLRGFLIQSHFAPKRADFAPFWVHL